MSEIHRKRFDNVTFMRIVDTTAGSLATYLLAAFKHKKQTPKDIKKILLIKFFGFGNIIMVSPSFRRLKELYPNAKIIFLTLNSNKKIVSLYKKIDKIIDIDLSNMALVPARILSAINHLHNENIDIAIDFEPYSRISAIITNLANAKFSVGFSISNNPRKKLYDETVECNDKEPIVIQFEKLVSKISEVPVKPENIKLEKIEYTKTDGELVDTLTGGKYENIIVFHVGNGPNAPEKRWEAASFAELAKRLTSRGKKIAIIGSKQDEKEIKEFKDIFGDNYIDLFNKISIPQLAYLLDKAKAYVSADTGPAHLAAAMETSSVILYGPSEPKVYGAWGTNVHFIYKSLWCSPCGSNKNSNEYMCINKIYQKCMKDISVDEVEKKLFEIMEKT